MLGIAGIFQCLPGTAELETEQGGLEGELEPTARCMTKQRSQMQPGLRGTHLLEPRCTDRALATASMPGLAASPPARVQLNLPVCLYET